MAQTRNKIGRPLLFLLCFVSTALPLFAPASFGSPHLQQPAQSGEPSPKLTVLDMGGPVRADLSTLRHTFGAVDPLRPSSLEHTFTLRNDSKVSFVIDHVQTSCGCTSALVTGEKNTTAPVTLAPGQKAGVRVSLDVTHLRAGKADKFVWVYV